VCAVAAWIEIPAARVVSGSARELDFEREVYALELSKRLADDAAAKRKPKKKRAGR
jgi:hypothetical protein